MKIENFPALRPTTGSTSSRTIQLETNMFKYVGAHAVLHYYDVRFSPDVNKRIVFDLFMRVYNENKEDGAHIAFDGVNTLISTKKFNNKTMRTGKEKIISIDITYKNSYDMNDINKGVDLSQHIQCMEVVTRFNQKMNSIADRNRVFGKGSEGSLNSIIELRTGLSHNVKITFSGFYLNVDAAFAGFYKSISLLDLVSEVISETRKPQFGGYNRRGGDRRDGRQEPKRQAQQIDLSREQLSESFWSNLEKFIKGVRVTTNHMGPAKREMTVRISGIYQQPASSVMFEMNGERISVASYFAKTYRPLRYPNLPVIAVKKAGMTLYFPIEVLNIASGQKYLKKLDEQQTSNLIKYAAKPPVDRFRIIKEKAEELKVLKNDANDSFGMVFDNKFSSCTGKVLNPPRIKFADKQLVDVKRGSWNLIKVKAYSPKMVHSCTLFLFKDPHPQTDVMRCIDSLVKIAANFGIKFVKHPVVKKVRSVDDLVKQINSELSIVVLPDKGSQRYEEIKRRTESETRTITQCILDKNLDKLNKPPFVGNLLLKINTKLGGENSILSSYSRVLSVPTLVLGIDVNHPGIGDLNSPSIVAIVGSMNANLTAFKTIIKQQERRHEVVEGFKEDIRTMLTSFYNIVKAKPQQIVVFRDGVGDSMFQEIFHKEIIAIKEACSSIQADYDPKITFIVAQKRHSVRFNNPRANFNAGENGNVAPGTVIEDIGHPSLFDFYLVSHHALQGTARPVRYLVLLNESKYTSDEIYEFVYGICHLYARATKSVSVVPPIYYAHLAAFRGKAYLEREAKSDAIVMRKNKPELNNRLFYV